MIFYDTHEREGRREEVREGGREGGRKSGREARRERVSHVDVCVTSRVPLGLDVTFRCET